MKFVERKTGKLVDVPDKDAQAAFQSGNYGIPKGGRLPVAVGTDVGTVDAKEAQRAFQAGMRVAEEQEYRKAAQAQQYGGVGGTAAAFGVGAVRGAGEALGMPVDDLALQMARQQNTFRQEYDPYAGSIVSMPEARARAGIIGLQEQNGIASGAGEMAGMAATAALMPGGGGLGMVGEAGEGLAVRAGAKAGGFISAGVRAGAEGAFLGGIGAINEAALGNEPLTAEKMVTGVTHGAILGGATGTLLHAPGAALGAAREAGGRFLSRMSPEAVESLATKQFGYAPKGLGSAVRDAYEKAAAAASGGDIETIKAFSPLDFSPEARANRALIYDAPRIQEDAARALREHGDAMLRDSRSVAEEAMGGMKESHVRRSVARGNEGETAAAALKHADDLIAANDAALNHEYGAKMTKELEQSSALAYRAKAAIQDAIEKGGPDVNAKIFMELDSLKRSTQTTAKQAQKGAFSVTSPLERQNQIREAGGFADAAENMRKALEDTSLWGKAAEDQQAINKAWTRQIDASERFRSRLTTEGGRDPKNPYLKQTVMDPAKAESYVRSLTNPNQDLTHQAIRDYVESTRELTKVIGDRFEIEPAKREAIERVASAAEAFGQTTERATDTLTKTNQLKALMSAEGEGSGMGAALGGLLGGAPGAALGAVGGAIMRPGKTIAQLAAVERMVSRVDAKIGGGISDFFAGKKLGGSTPAGRLLQAGGMSERGAFEKSISNIQEAAGSPERLSALVEKATGQDLAHAAPGTTGEFAAVVTRGLQFLASKVPAGFSPNTEVLAPQLQKPIYSDAEMRSWTRYAAAVNDPSTILESMGRGTLTPEEIEVMREVYPQLYQQTQQQIVTRVASLTKPLDRSQALQLSTFFAVPVDANMTPTMLRALSTSAPKVPAPHFAKMKEPKSLDIGNTLSMSHRTDTQRGQQ